MLPVPSNKAWEAPLGGKPLGCLLLPCCRASMNHAITAACAWLPPPVLLPPPLRPAQPSGGGGEGAPSPEEAARRAVEEVGDRLPAGFDLEEIRGRAEEETPYVMVALQVGKREG